MAPQPVRLHLMQVYPLDTLQVQARAKLAHPHTLHRLVEALHTPILRRLVESLPTHRHTRHRLVEALRIHILQRLA